MIKLNTISKFFLPVRFVNMGLLDKETAIDSMNDFLKTLDSNNQTPTPAAVESPPEAVEDIAKIAHANKNEAISALEG